MPNPEPETYTAAEVAAKFSVAERTILKNAAAGLLPFKMLRIGRVVRFAVRDVNAALGVLNVGGETAADAFGRGVARGLTINRAGKPVQVRG